ncbi:MAG: hypothetical protein GF332_01280 [Candidatus Moranbacteria bacterium]|nr:hypothetical protein [Candidatus Moranbacteria bacterium]
MAKIAIIGSGVVGQATGKGLIKGGHEVYFFDINKELLSDLKKQGYNADTPDKIKIQDIDTYIFTVSTPTVNGKVKLDYLKTAAISLGKKLKNKKDYFLLVGRSTMPPGTTRDLIAGNVEKYSGKKTGVDFGYCMNPEYLREKSSVQDFSNPWVVLIGAYDERSYRMLEKIYSRFKCPIYRLSVEGAEMQKYVHNLFNAAKISFFNEMRMVAEKLNLDADKIFSITATSAEGIWNEKYGLRDLGPFDGMCLPKDTSAFLDWARSNTDISMNMLEQVIQVNQEFMDYRKQKNKK